MVNLTTASLEPAPLSSGWKSGSLPTGFTPTILGARKGGRDATRCETEEDNRERKRECSEGRGLDRGGGGGGAAPGALSAESRQEPSGEGAGTREGGRRPREVRRAAPSSHRAARPPALAQVDVISASPVLAPAAQSRYALRGPTPPRSLSLAGAAQAQASRGHTLRCRVRRKNSCVPPRLVRPRLFSGSFLGREGEKGAPFPPGFKATVIYGSHNMWVRSVQSSRKNIMHLSLSCVKKRKNRKHCPSFRDSQFSDRRKQ